MSTAHYDPFSFRYLGRTLRFRGGPYRNRPAALVGIKLAAEIEKPFDHSVPCADFSTPTQADMAAGVEFAIKQAMIGNEVYAGCMGGIGRTGTFYSCLAKVFLPDEDEDDDNWGPPVAVIWVREHYLDHAVETKGQQDFIDAFDPKPIRKKLFGWAVRAWLGLLR